MKLPKGSKSARRRAAWKAARDVKAIRQERARALFEERMLAAAETPSPAAGTSPRDQVDLARPGAERAVDYIHAPSLAELPPAGSRVSDTQGNEFKVGAPEPAPRESQPSAARAPLHRVEERAAPAPTRRVLHRSMGWSPLLGLAMAASMVGATDGLRAELTPRKKEEE